MTLDWGCCATHLRTCGVLLLVGGTICATGVLLLAKIRDLSTRASLNLDSHAGLLEQLTTDIRAQSRNSATRQRRALVHHAIDASQMLLDASQ